METEAGGGEGALVQAGRVEFLNWFHVEVGDEIRQCEKKSCFENFRKFSSFKVWNSGISRVSQRAAVDSFCEDSKLLSTSQWGLISLGDPFFQVVCEIIGIKG